MSEQEKLKTIKYLRSILFFLACAVICAGLVYYFWNNPVPGEYNYLISH